MTLLAGLLVIAVAIFAILRKIDVRLSLLLAALVLGVIAGHPDLIVQTFLTTLVREQFVIPIGCSLGFAYVLRRTGCDQHLVHLLVRPIQRIRPLLVPGTVLIGALVNIPIISQMSTAVLIGTVLVPLLRAARISPITTGAALLLGSSLGGELLNPGAPEVRTVSESAGVPVTAHRWLANALPLFLVELSVATVLFWLLSWRAEARHAKEIAGRPADAAEDSAPAFRINLFKAAVPFVPIGLLFLTALPEPFRLFRVPTHWLVDEAHFTGPRAALQAVFDSRLIGAAMLVGAIVAAVTDRGQVGHTALVFFEGVGYAFTHIISLIVAASCFGKGVEQIGLAALLGRMLEASPGLLLPSAVSLPLSFAVLCGSGMATTQSLYGFFVAPAHALGHDPLRVGAVVSLAAAAGRTMSPVAAVTLMCSSLVGANPLRLVRRVAVPLLAGLLAVLLTAFLRP